MPNYLLLYFILGVLLVCTPRQLDAQVSINNDNASPDPSAMFDIQSNNRGFLMPRMTEGNRLSINSPANGLFLYQTDEDSRFYYNEGTPGLPEWAKVGIQTSNLICEARIPIDSVFNGTNYIINESGSYYLTGNITISVGNVDGIQIDANNVTLDLNGYTLDGDDTGSDGIFVVGDHSNIIIKNGVVANWDRQGVLASTADQSIFIDLIVRNNNGNGLVADDNCLVYRCAAEGNRFTGLGVGTGGIIFESTASNNTIDGLKCGFGGIIINCTSANNEANGINLGTGSRVENCNTFVNGENGIRVGGINGQVINCIANENRGNGIEVSNYSLIINCTANKNGQCWLDGNGCDGITDDGAGIRVLSNTQVINNTCNDNIMGIRVSGSDTYVSGNHCEGNRHAGIAATSSGSFVIRNFARNNGFNPVQGLTDAGNNPTGNIMLDPNCSFGPIIDVSSAGNILNTPGANHPYANFTY